MRKGKVVRLKGYQVVSFFTQNSLLLLLTFLFFLGVLLGTFSGNRFAVLKDFSENYLQTFIAKRTNPTFWPLMLHSFLTSLFVLFLSFSLGASMLGVVLTPLLLFFRGFLYGSIAALLYSTYAVKGIAFHAVLVLPAAFFLILALLLAARESVQFSLQIAKISLPAASAGDLSVDFGNFCGRYLVLSGLVLLSAVTDAAMSCVFADHFTIG